MHTFEGVFEDEFVADVFGSPVIDGLCGITVGVGGAGGPLSEAGLVPGFLR